MSEQLFIYLYSDLQTKFCGQYFLGTTADGTKFKYSEVITDKNWAVLNEGLEQKEVYRSSKPVDRIVINNL